MNERMNGNKHTHKIKCTNAVWLSSVELLSALCASAIYFHFHFYRHIYIKYAFYFDLHYLDG